jgi:hypothetical protein
LTPGASMSLSSMKPSLGSLIFLSTSTSSPVALVGSFELPPL